jgi:hypothetical protein
LLRRGEALGGIGKTHQKRFGVLLAKRTLHVTDDDKLTGWLVELD